MALHVHLIQDASLTLAYKDFAQCVITQWLDLTVMDRLALLMLLVLPLLALEDCAQCVMMQQVECTVMELFVQLTLTACQVHV
jgi:hypothetical protein